MQELGLGSETLLEGVMATIRQRISARVLTPGATPPPSLSGVGGVGGSEGTFGFGDMVREVSAKQAAASEAMKEVMTGGGMPLHQAMIAAQEASLSFQLMVEVRNKLLESYQELMRMQV